jgi:hypothetical protein
MVAPLFDRNVQKSLGVLYAPTVSKYECGPVKGSVQ